MRGILIKGCWLPSGDGRVRGDIAVEGDTILAVGENLSLPPGWQAGEEINGEGLLALPGLVNAHTHTPMTLLRGAADDLPLNVWLNDRVLPLEDLLTAEDAYWGAQLAIWEMLATGTTTFADMYFFMDQVARAVEESGIRACLSRGLAGIQPNGEQALQENLALVDQWQGCGEGRITTMIGPHALYTCPLDYLGRVAELAAARGVGVHIHLAETQHEYEESFKNHGCSPTVALDKAGLFNVPVLAAHGTHLSQEDILLLKTRGVSVAHCPESNMKLGSGRAPIPELLAAGVNVALGTDGAASNNDLDLLGEMRSAALLHKVTGDPTAVSGRQVQHMATVAGARALGIKDLGELQPGFKADIILLSTTGPHWHPATDPVTQLVYSGQASDVQGIIVNGRVLMLKGCFRTLDTERIAREVESRAMSMGFSRR